ncbi:hypothetical protein ATANTOWER_004094 [Ataeniobius toweri]|uniref:Uncharacterized protein n=1 Tax=Ataeniobius toweri TaxID=208326 RepID=A0ABU7CEL6_9TELE|nr:hypothetical protein [Ataeniobius toweri]
MLTNRGQMGKSKLTCEISAGQQLFLGRSSWSTAMEHQRKNFRLNASLFVHAARTCRCHTARNAFTNELPLVKNKDDVHLLFTVFMQETFEINCWNNVEYKKETAVQGQAADICMSKRQHV